MTFKRLSLVATLTGVLALALYAVPAFAGAAEGLEIIGQPKNWAYGFQPPASPVKLQMEEFHNHLLVPIITLSSLFVLALLIWVVVRYNRHVNPTPSRTTHNTMLEIVWTVVPVVILVLLVVPSMKLLYTADRTHEAEMTLNIKGYQWYWGYEYPDHGGVNFLANLVSEQDLKKNNDPRPRLLATDNPIVLPVDTNIRLLITAADVLHAFAVPAFGVKLDAVPGHTNETWVRIDKPGTYYGQCSELCGANHGFMPIEVNAVSKERFAQWIHAQGGKMPAEIAAEKAAAAPSVAPGAAAGDTTLEKPKDASEAHPPGTADPTVKEKEAGKSGKKSGAK
ncbi:MAG: cytochrome c oxidase subunit II [bacterium]|nr:cytochrome c oxidase subunit II [bacterium]